ncbi:sensor domain-containing diguanylate cyclase [Alteromonas halophila]|uniref:diguanylate cyclase n=1 Tax=Alteromonas halophila TaxID=516698 RepID=A0A918JG27_9ALTE|nr:diguanylate cyclase [Alteromonas halophila]GGW79156.1 hypothetical protein GCM10007391_09820 [Alteromonas halophila]
MKLDVVSKHLLLIFSWLALWRLAVFMEYAPHASIWFPPAGLTFAAYLLVGWRVVGTMFIACMLSTFWEHMVFQDQRTISELLTSGAIFAVIHNLIYGVSAHLLRGAIEQVDTYNLYHLVMRFMITASVSSFFMALTGMVLLYGGLSLASFKESWLGWWIGDMSGILVLTPLFISFMNRLYPKRGLLTALQFSLPATHRRWSYGAKLLLCSSLLTIVVIMADLFNSPEIACFVFFLALPQMWIVYTETPYRTALSLALYSFLTAALVAVFGVGTQAYIYQFAINVVACSAYFAMGVPALVSANRMLHQKAHIDHLTQAYTRQHFLTLAEQQIKQARRYGQATSLLLIDVDKFKLINDKYGHSVGDRVLERIAVEIKSALRESDILGRFGGDEFMVMLPQTQEDDAFEVAEQIRERLAGLSFVQPDLSVSCSFGVTGLDASQSFQDAFEEADNSLLAAKRAGRNVTLMASETPLRQA